MKDKEFYIVKETNRLIRLKDAPKYLGMGRHTFNRDVRDYVTELPVGKSGIAFDKLELDAWVEHYRASSGRPPTKRKELWDAKERQVSANVGNYGTSTNTSSVDAFVKALDLIHSKKRKNI